MTFSSELIALGTYLAGEFTNQPQALAEPLWYVNLLLWLRPTALFTEDSITLFAEQANILKLNQPYRSRIIRLQKLQNNPVSLQVKYYMLKDYNAFLGSGRNKDILNRLTSEDITLLPSCSQSVKVEQIEINQYQFSTHQVSSEPCCFSYQGKTYQVSLGFSVNSKRLETYDKGIDPETGKATWGAVMGPYRYSKQQDFSNDLIF